MQRPAERRYGITLEPPRGEAQRRELLETGFELGIQVLVVARHARESYA